MHVVVTGSTGFIGSALIPGLLARGHSVTAISRSGINNSLLNDNSLLTELLVKDLCKMREHDFPQCDAVVHLAGIAHRKGMKDHDVYESVNYEATIHLAGLAATRGCTHFIFMSTAKVHADSTDSPINSSSPYNPPDTYSDTKARAEQKLLASDFPMAITALRPPAVLGLPAKANLKHLIRLAKSNLFVPVSSPSNKRCFISLNNLCSATMKCMESQRPVNGGYLVHDNSPISTADLLEVIASANDTKVRLVRLPRPVFAAGNKAIQLVTGKSLIAPFYENFLIDCTAFEEQYGWHPESGTHEQIQSLFQH